VVDYFSIVISDLASTRPLLWISIILPSRFFKELTGTIFSLDGGRRSVSVCMRVCGQYSGSDCQSFLTKC